MILAVGVFAVVIIGLGLTRSQQIQAQGKLDDELSIAEMRLNKLQLQDLNQQLAELQGRYDQSETQLTAAKDKLRQTVESIDVTDKFFAVARSCNVQVTSLSSSGIKSDKLGGIACSKISLNADVSSQVPNLIDFIIRLNHDFSTGLVDSTQISVTKTPNGDQSSAKIAMVVYSYQGE